MTNNYRYCYWNCRGCNTGDDGSDVRSIRAAAYDHARRTGHRVDGSTETTFTYGGHMAPRPRATNKRCSDGGPRCGQCRRHAIVIALFLGHPQPLCQRHYRKSLR